MLTQMDYLVQFCGPKGGGRPKGCIMKFDTEGWIRSACAIEGLVVIARFRHTTRSVYEGVPEDIRSVSSYIIHANNWKT